MKRCALIILGLAASGLGCTSQPNAVSELLLRLTGPAELSLEEDATTWDVSIINDGSHGTDIVLPGDGSESGMRTPLTAWSVIPAEESREYPRERPRSSGARCGNINAIDSSAVALLPPGGALSLGPWIGQPAFPGVGTYRVVFYYENQPDIPVSGIPLRSHDARALRRIRRTAPFLVRSNEITVVVRG